MSYFGISYVGKMKLFKSPITNPSAITEFSLVNSLKNKYKVFIKGISLTGVIESYQPFIKRMLGEGKGKKLPA